MYPFSWTHITDRGFTLFKLNLFSLSVEIVSYCRLISVDIINEFRPHIWCGRRTIQGTYQIGVQVVWFAQVANVLVQTSH